MHSSKHTGRNTKDEGFSGRSSRYWKKQKGLRSKFKLHKKEHDEEESPSLLPFNGSELNLLEHHLCYTPVRNAPSKPGPKFRPALLYGYFHRGGQIEGLCIVPRTTSIGNVYPSMMLCPTDQANFSDKKYFSALILNHVSTITNSPNFFKVPSETIDSTPVFLSREEVLAFYARRICALLFGKLENMGNFAGNMFEDATHRGAKFNLTPNAPDDILLPDVAGRWGKQEAYYPFGITQDEIDDLTSRIKEIGPISPTSFEIYLDEVGKGCDLFAITPELGAAALRKLYRLPGFPEDFVNEIEESLNP